MTAAPELLIRWTAHRIIEDVSSVLLYSNMTCERVNMYRYIPTTHYIF